MTNRTVTTHVTFSRPFRVPGIAETQPAGTYLVETEEELLPALSFEAWRRIDTVIHLPRRAGGAMVDQVAPIEPQSLRAALDLDAQSGVHP